MKSCSAKESKVFSTEDDKYVLNAFKKDTQEELTEEQILINKKLLESGIDEKGLGWLEKTNIFKTINVSLDTAESGRLQRTSPRLAKAANSTAVKWIENSFEDIKHECKKDSQISSVKKRSPVFKSRKSDQEAEKSVLKSNHKLESVDSQKDVKTSSDSPEAFKKVHYVKIDVEENSKVECNSLGKKFSQGSTLGKKRSSQPEIHTTETPKKLKMDEVSDEVSSQDTNFLADDATVEKQKANDTFKMRNIKMIVSECEIRNKMWKETFSKYKCPTRWGMPIVRNCSEKWDGKQIPPKLLHRFQKYLCEKDLTHPIFFPLKPQSSVDLNNSNSEISSQTGTSSISECRIDFDSNVRDLDEKRYIVKSNRTYVENNLNASTSGEDTGQKMVLRNRTQQKTVISDEEEYSSDDSDDWLVKQKSTKKVKFNARNKKASDQSNKQLVLKLERCNINKGNEKEGGRKNNNKNGADFNAGSVTPSNGSNQVCSKSVPDPDTMVCPICSHRFKKQFIESHATECASKTYKD